VPIITTITAKVFAMQPFERALMTFRTIHHISSLIDGYVYAGDLAIPLV
jgi:hypothetical protein